MVKMSQIKIVKTIGGELHQYLKNIKLVGRVREEYNNDFIIYGCIRGYEQEFYQGILDFDKATGGEMGFNYVEDVEVFWMDEGEGMFLVINKGDYELIR
mgnify:CR=1 FL=1